MIRRVRRKFIGMTMAMLTAVLMIPLIALNVITYVMSYNQTKNLLNQILFSETGFHEEIPGNLQPESPPNVVTGIPNLPNEPDHSGDLMQQNEKPDDTPDVPHQRNGREPNVTISHFICYTDKNGQLTETIGTDDYTEEECQEFALTAFASKEEDGHFGSLHYCQRNIPSGSVIVFTDCSAEQLLLKKMIAVSILVFFCMEGIVLILTIKLTKRAMKPMQEAFEQQRQFISDAGHELKTPLTIISANVEILQDEIGENKWLMYIHSQTDRMRKLIRDMMDLTKLEMKNQQEEFTNFSLSTAVTNAVLPFESQAFEQEKNLTLDIEENIQYTGNPEQIRQLTAIFVDNAIQYSNAHGEIRVSLKQNRDKKILQIYNTGKGVTEAEREKIFERFYRSDFSRSRATGGYGLGLSIAKSIADKHKIRIQVESEYEHWICFTLIL